MDAESIDQEYEKLQTEFQDVAQSVATLAAKLQAAGKAGDGNAAKWFNDIELIAKDLDDEQTQAKVLLLTIHGFITNLGEQQTQVQAPAAPAATEDQKPPLFAPGYEPQQNQPQPQLSPHHGLFGGMMGGYGSGGFAQAMEMGAGMSLGADLVSSIFR